MVSLRRDVWLHPPPPSNLYCTTTTKPVYKVVTVFVLERLTMVQPKINASPASTVIRSFGNTPTRTGTAGLVTLGIASPWVPINFKFETTATITSYPSTWQQTKANTRFFYKQRVYKHTQPQIREILSTLLSTPLASDFEIDNKIS